MERGQHISFQSKKEIKALQEKKLGELLSYLEKYSPFYKKLFVAHGINVDKIKNLEDISQLPVIGKEELQQYNDDFLCVSRDQVKEYTSTSGTLGSPVT